MGLFDFSFTDTIPYDTHIFLFLEVYKRMKLKNLNVKRKSEIQVFKGISENKIYKNRNDWNASCFLYIVVWCVVVFFLCVVVDFFLCVVVFCFFCTLSLLLFFLCVVVVFFVLFIPWLVPDNLYEMAQMQNKFILLLGTSFCIHQRKTMNKTSKIMMIKKN